MDYLTVLLLIFFVLATIHIFISNLGIRSYKHGKLPPGPRPLPIIGNILELGAQPHLALTTLSKTYGPIISLKLGSITTIAISSPEIAKEALYKNDPVFSSRKIPDSVFARDHGKLSVAYMPTTSKWRILRRACATRIFSPQQLDSTQILRQRKVQELLDFVHECSNKGEALEIGEAVFTTVLNLLSNTFFSMDLAHYTSNKSQEFRDIVQGVMEDGGKPNIVDFFPIFRFLDPQGTRARMKNHFEKVTKIFDGIIEDRLRLRALKVESVVYNDALDSILDLMAENDSQLNRPDLLHLFLDLFVAGLDTTSSTVEWAMAELLRNPKELGKARKELQNMFDKDHQLKDEDVPMLPFLQAVVKETFRMHPAGPLLPRKTNDDVELYGFMVPKDAQILVNVWAMGLDSCIWTNPNQFMPERFLDSENNVKDHGFELIPFGAGRRICPGAPLASKIIPFLLASLLRFYDWKLPDGQNPENMDMTGKFGIILHKSKPLRAIPIKA